MLISEVSYTNAKEWLRKYIDEHCIVRNTVMPGKAPNTTYTWMFYLRRGLFNPSFINAISQCFLYKMEREVDVKLNFQITGLETAATPMLVGIPIVARAFNIDINSFVVRKDQKEYGLKNWTEGIVKEHAPVVMLDDLCNSSASLARCLEILNYSHPNVDVLPVAFTIVNKSNNTHDTTRRSGDMYLPEHFRVISIFDLDDFNLSNPSH